MVYSAGSMEPSSVRQTGERNRRSVMMIAFHFPPWKGSSGLERTLSFYRHLPAHDWQPIVLTADSRAYPATSDERMEGIRGDDRVSRAFALDATRHLSIRGRYPGIAAVPDPWISWAIGAIPKGLLLARRHRPSAIWSTYPIATAHIIGYMLSRLTGLPWITDFRDPMVETNPRTGEKYPTNARIRRARLWIEAKCARHAARAVFCTEGAREIFLERYPAFERERAIVIPNGYDEAAFQESESAPPPSDASLSLLHSGVLYPGPDRDPRHFLQALKLVLEAKPHWRTRLRVVFRATGFDDRYAPVIRELGLTDVVRLEPAIPYSRALAEMKAADGLLLFQGYTSNPAIPAKLYEYLRAQRPILAMVDAQGDTAKLLDALQVGNSSPIDEETTIAAELSRFLDTISDGTARTLSEAELQRFERSNGAVTLAQLLNACTAPVRG